MSKKQLTVRIGRVGFDAQQLAAMSLTEAKKVLKKYPENMVRQAHEQAVKLTKKKK